MFTQTFFFNSESLRKNLWDAEDRLRAVDLNPEADSDKPLIAVYTYDAGGERTIKYVPARTDARYSAKNAGNADRFESIIYPNALITAKALDFVEQLEYRKDPKVVNYTKHYYIGSERIASSIGTYRGTGGYKGTERDAVRVYMNNKVTEVAEAVRQDFEKLEKHVQLAEPFVYSSHFDDPWYNFHDPEYYSTYWYHPDHLGSSSYITNLEGEISQHMEYLPFGETLVEEHLNSNNSPYKFNAKEFDSETGNYYYGARYYSPRYNLMLSVDPLYEMFPGWSPYHYVHNNPVNLIDPTGMSAEPPSTHTDESGNVIAVYDDGDDGVYVHSNGTTKAQIDQQRTDNKNTGGTGTNIGEIGGTLNAGGIYTNTLDKNIEEAKGIYNPYTFRNYVKTNGKWDLKNNKKTIYGLANDGKTQFSFNGELMESQDIGNHHFGAVALAYGLFPSEKFILEQAGEYQIKSGTSRPEWQIYKEETRYNYSKLGTPIPYKVKVMQPPYGDDPRDQKWIKSGFQYFKNK